MKKLISVVLSVLIVVGMVPLSVLVSSAATEYTEGYYTYTVTDGKATIIDCNTSISGDIVIPSTLGGYPVTAIGCDGYTRSSIKYGYYIPLKLKPSVFSGGFGFFDTTP